MQQFVNKLQLLSETTVGACNPVY